MSDPTPEQVEALARVMDPLAFFGESDYEVGGAVRYARQLAREQAGRVLAAGYGPKKATGVELTCDECQQLYATWFADNPVWNLVMGGPGAASDPGGMLCPRCFMLRAEDVYDRPVWRLFLNSFWQHDQRIDRDEEES